MTGKRIPLQRSLGVGELVEDRGGLSSTSTHGPNEGGALEPTGHVVTVDAEEESGRTDF